MVNFLLVLLFFVLLYLTALVVSYKMNKHGGPQGSHRHPQNRRRRHREEPEILITGEIPKYSDEELHRIAERL